MIGRILGRWFGGGDDRAPAGAASVLASETYAGCEIQAAPVKEANGWRVAGVLSKTIDGVEKSHQFVRADTCADADSAAAMTLRKARQLIDEQGESIFDQRRDPH